MCVCVCVCVFDSGVREKEAYYISAKPSYPGHMLASVSVLVIFF